MDINTDTTPALHAGSAVRANPLHTEYTIHLTSSTLHYEKKNDKSKTKSIDTRPPPTSKKHTDPLPKVKAMRNTHTQSDYIVFFIHYCTMGGRDAGPAEMARAGICREIARWLSVTWIQHECTRRAITNGTRPELQAVPIYTENDLTSLIYKGDILAFQKKQHLCVQNACCYMITYCFMKNLVFQWFH